MTHSLSLMAALLVLMGCSRTEQESKQQLKPLLIHAPTLKSLESHLGSDVAIEGHPWAEKEGDYIDANGVNILVETPVGVPYKWPRSSRTIRVSGTLERSYQDYDFPYILKSPTWDDVTKTSP